MFFALVLAAEVLLIAIEANETNDLVMFLRDIADKVDLGLFSLSDPIKDFNEKVPNFSDTGTALFNYGLAAIGVAGHRPHRSTRSSAPEPTRRGRVRSGSPVRT